MFPWSDRILHRLLGTSILAAGILIPMSCDAAPKVVKLLDPTQGPLQNVYPMNADVSKSKTSDSALIVQTNAGHDYPGISVVSPTGSWNLNDTPVVTMTVRNQSDRDIAVILSLENDDSDGKNGSSAEKVNLPAGQTGTLQMIAGTWYGKESDTFEPSRVARFNVMVDQSPEPATFSIVEIYASDVDHSVQHILESDYFANLKPFLGKGLNIGNTLEAPNEGEWGVRLEKGQLKLVREAGFDSIRLPVRWSAHASNQPPYRLEASFQRRVKEVVDDALNQGLQVLLNDHHYEKIFEEPAQHRERFLGLWRQIAAQYADYPPELAFEIMNEPHGEIDAEFWNALLLDVVSIIRERNPDRWIVIGPTGWNSVNDLPKLKLPQNDPKIALTFHYYSPMEVTHQGAPWLEKEADDWLGTQWTASNVQQTQVQLDFNKALTFGFDNNVPIYLGEFGVYEKAPMQTRVTWTRKVAGEAVRRKMGYAYWEFYSGFGLYDPVQKRWREPLKDAVLNP